MAHLKLVHALEVEIIILFQLISICIFFLLKMSECVKWGSVGMNAGMLLLMNRQKTHSATAV